jgi:regulator of telomere elongation helicase 1
MCVNPKVKKATSTASEINHDCSKLGKERKCRYKNKLEGFQPPPNESGSFDGMQPVMDMEDLVTMGKQHKVCPFYYSRSQVEEADLVLVPYNYLFDKDSRATTLADIPWDNTVIIFDEAHNLESFASESASFDLSTLDISRCIQEISRALGYVEAFPEHENKIKKDNILRLKSIFLGLEEYILNMNNQAAHRGEYMMDIFQKGASITHTNHELFILEVRKLVDIFLDVQGGSNSKGASGLQHFVQCVKRVYGEQTEARCLAKAQSYRVHITPKTNGNSNSYNKNSNNVGRTVSYWCFAPSEAMRELANLKVRSIIVTSGTLSPLQSYAMELDLPFPNRLENPHIVQDDQIHVRVVGNGVSGKVLSSSYERRQDNEYYTELGNTLVALSRVIPGGMLIFFPSYGVMQTCIERWGGPASSRPNGYGKPVSNFFAAKKSNTSSRYSFPHTPTAFNTSKETLTPWKRLLGNKAVVLEPRSTSDLPDAISEFHKFLNMPKSRGVALFGVCRGKISEVRALVTVSMLCIPPKIPASQLFTWPSFRFICSNVSTTLRESILPTTCVELSLLLGCRLLLRSIRKLK